jgi:alpha-L-rhamnosidase
MTTASLHHERATPLPSPPGPVTFEHHIDAFGIGEAAPRLSWILPADVPHQHSYELEFTRAGARTTTGRLDGSGSLLVPWATAPLTSRESVRVRVRIWSHETSGPSPWSEPALVEAGLLDPDDWKARPVGAAWPEDPDRERRPARVRRAFTVDKPAVRARLYITAHGLFEAEINGRRVGDDALAPGWTVYGQRLRYLTYDVTAHVNPGDNTIGAWLGDGWYRGRFGFEGGHRNLYGTDLSLIAQLEIQHDDGTRTVVATDATWQAAPGPILTSNLYDGETFDARLEDPAWSRPSVSAPADADSCRAWSPVAVATRDHGTLVAPVGPTVRCTEERSPVTVEHRGPGRYLLDFGQNLVGRLRITLDAPAGHTVSLRHAEVLQDGELALGPLREARATDTYTSAGAGEATWEPRFTIHGFRYAEITGWPDSLRPGQVTARVYHTAMARTGWFECSNELVNQLHDNVVWSMRGNFVDIPTDCPARDERLGWTGDLQIFAPTASYLYDCSGMLDSWLTDVAAEQLPDGTIPWYVPVIPGGSMWTPIQPGAAWGDVAALTPWVLYQRFGDLELLRRHYPAGKRWVDLVERLAGPGRLWDSGFQLGDWLDPAAPPDDPAASLTDRHLVATGYFAWSTRHIALAAQALGLPEADHYAALAEEIAAAFRARYTKPDGTLTNLTATAHSLAIAFRLLDGQTATQAAGDRLAELVRRDGARIATGFVGTPLICDALTDTGHLDVAYDLLTQTECPSWLYPVTQGATTIWERWDSLRPDGTLNPGGMTSFNHYALGAVADWLHRAVGGITSTGPGYRTVSFRPRPGGGITWATARHETPYGTAAISWQLNADGIEATVTVPAGCTGTVELPGCDAVFVGPGTHELTSGEARESAA